MCARSNLVAFAITASALCGAIGASRRWHEDGGEDVKWVRMCTLTSRGGSAINATVPCGVRVRDESAVREEDRPDVDGNTRLRHRNGDGTVVSTTLGGKEENHHRDGGQNATVEDDDDDTPHSNVSAGLGATDGEEVDGEGEEYDEDDDDDGVTVVDAQDDGVTMVDVQDDAVIVVDAQDDGTSGEGHDAAVDETTKSDVRRDGAVPSEVSGLGAAGNAGADDDNDDRHRVEETDGDSVTVVRDGPNGLQGHQKHGAVAKALLGYLLEARNRLHGKIRTYTTVGRLWWPAKASG